MGGIRVTKRSAAERGTTDIGWLHSRHTFSFGEYHDPAHMGYRSLRVINDDTVAPGKGFGTHPHRDMEILSYVTSGRLAHRDSMGNGRVIEAGQLQYMSAGTGVTHSEFNPSETEPVKFLQIWIVPGERGGEPRYAELNARRLARENGLALLASGDGREGSVALRQDAEVHFGRVAAGRAIDVLADGAHGHNWLHVILGGVSVEGESFGPGDGCAIEADAGFAIRCERDAEFLLFRLA